MAKREAARHLAEAAQTDAEERALLLEVDKVGLLRELSLEADREYKRARAGLEALLAKRRAVGDEAAGVKYTAKFEAMFRREIDAAALRGAVEDDMFLRCVTVALGKCDALLDKATLAEITKIKETEPVLKLAVKKPE